MIDRIKEFIWDCISERLNLKINLELIYFNKKIEEIQKELESRNTKN